MLCSNCKHLKTKKVGYVSSRSFCGLVGDRGNGKGLGVLPWYDYPHPKCPLKNKPINEEKCEMAITNQSTKVVTGTVRLSYVHVFEPNAIDGGEEKYSCSILIPKSDKETLRKIKEAVEAAKELGKTSWGGKVPANVKLPLRDGDEERPEDEAYAGHYFLNASSKNKPGIAKPGGKGPDGKTKFIEITDTTEVYSGCYARVSLNLYPFNVSGNKGVAAGLNNLVKVSDGDYLGGKSSLSDDFAGEEFDDDNDGLDDLL